MYGRRGAVTRSPCGPCLGYPQEAGRPPGSWHKGCTTTDTLVATKTHQVLGLG